MYDVIVVGGGIAALSAAIYTSRKALSTLVIAKEIGGQTNWALKMENYPGFKKINGADLISHVKEQTLALKTKIYEGEIVKKIILKKDKSFIVHTDKKKYQSRTIIIASGGKPKKLNISGEEEFLGRGVAYCATCDAPLFKGKDVVVVGGGNAALGAALELAKHTKKIYLLVRSNRMRGDQSTLRKVKMNSKINTIMGAKLQKIKGDKFVNSVIYKYKNTKDVKLAVEGVFIEIGSVPVANFVPKEVKKNKKKEIIIDHKTNQTSVPGIYAAGDVTDNLYKQAIISAGDAAKAAISVSEYLKKSLPKQ